MARDEASPARRASHPRTQPHHSRDRNDGTATEQTPLLGTSTADDDEVSELSVVASNDDDKPVTWRSIPNKEQLAMVVFARLAEPLTARSLTSYLFYQLRWFNPELPDSTIAYRAGLFTAAFAAAQCVTSMFWGHAADSPVFGRKKVLLIGLSGTCISALGLGFSRSFAMAVCFRLLQGALNGNIGVLRTMVSEIVVDKRYRPRAFLLLPMCFNVGNIIGPLLGGFLAEPFTSLPSIFGPGSWLGGKDGVRWMAAYPYALPQLVSAAFLLMSALGVIFGLDETHPMLRHRQDPGRKLGRFLFAKCFGRRKDDGPEYERIPNGGQIDSPTTAAASEADDVEQQAPAKPDVEKASIRELLRPNVVLTLLQQHVQTLHTSAWNALLFTMLPAARSPNTDKHLPFLFSGGLGMSAKQVGLANTVIGCIGIPLQILLFPWLSGRLGILRSYRAFLPLAALAYFALPYMVLVPDRSAVLWPCLAALLSAHTFARVFIGPATVLLVNDCAPHPTLLGTVHGIGSSVASAARMLGPTVGGAALGWGLSHNAVGTPFWGMTALAVINWVLIWWVRDVDMGR